MQTFLTSYSFQQSAANLDSKRLNKQILEAIQLYELATNKLYLSKGFATPYKNHPAFKWWANCPKSLAYYIFNCTNEMYNRFGKCNKLWETSAKIIEDVGFDMVVSVPNFLTSEIVESHKNALLYKTEANYILYDYCYINAISLNSINANNCQKRFVPFLLSYSSIKNFTTMRFSDSSKVPTISDVDKKWNEFEFYAEKFPNNYSELAYVW